MVGRAERHEPSKQHHFVNPAGWDEPVASSSLGCAQTPSSFPAPSLPVPAVVQERGRCQERGRSPLGPLPPFSSHGEGQGGQAG